MDFTSLDDTQLKFALLRVNMHTDEFVATYEIQRTFSRRTGWKKGELNKTRKTRYVYSDQRFPIGEPHAPCVMPHK